MWEAVCLGARMEEEIYTQRVGFRYSNHKQDKNEKIGGIGDHHHSGGCANDKG